MNPIRKLKYQICLAYAIKYHLDLLRIQCNHINTKILLRFTIYPQLLDSLS
jgi:hypothetical protein